MGDVPPSRQGPGARDDEDLTEVLAEMRRALGACSAPLDLVDTWKVETLARIIRHLHGR
jgi:hypothetical protein